MTQHTTQTTLGARAGGRGFTLVELLVVVAVIALLVGVLLPALSGAVQASRAAQSASNIRQLVTSLHTYAAEYDQDFPTNIKGLPDPVTGKLNAYWYDTTRIGAYLPSFDETNLAPNNPENNTVGGGMLVSPQHPDGGRSYTMNHWAASATNAQQFPSSNSWRYYGPDEIPQWQGGGLSELGKGFNLSTGRRTTDLLLVGEAWGLYGSQLSDTVDETRQRWFTAASIGSTKLPGARFGAGDDPVDAARWERGWVNNAPEMAGITGNSIPTEIPWYRHPKISDDRLTRDGAAHFGFLDGHVELLRTGEVADDETGLSTYEVLWTDIDERVEAGDYDPN